MKPDGSAPGSAQPPVPEGLDELHPRQLLGRYELLFRIARGGMGEVWAARLSGTRGFQKILAVKTMLPGMTDDPQFEQMFLDEASLASRIRHPHVVEVLDLGEQDGILYLVMEWIDGEPLSTLIRRVGKTGGIPLPIAVTIAQSVCRGLHAAHELADEDGTPIGLVHRDVSPQNILVNFDGVAKLVDFGIATAKHRLAQTTAGQAKGKFVYMAPEQLLGGTIDRRADIFALGTVLYLVTTGKHPFRGNSDTETAQRILDSDNVTPPSRLIREFSPMLQSVILRALQQDPAKRFPTANEMLRALSRALPVSQRLPTEEDVRDYVRDVLADRIEKRRSLLQAALRAADNPAPDRPSQPGAEAISQPGEELSDPSVSSSVFLLDPAPSGVVAMDFARPSAPSAAALEDPRPVTSGSATLDGPRPAAARSATLDVSTPIPPAGRRKKGPLYGGIALVVALAAIAVSLTLRLVVAQPQSEPAAGSAAPSSPSSTHPLRPSTVDFEVVVQGPERATIAVAGRELSGRRVHVTVPRADAPVTVVVTAEGYVEARVNVVPSQNRSVVVPMSKAIEVPAPSATAPKKPVPRYVPPAVKKPKDLLDRRH